MIKIILLLCFMSYVKAINYDLISTIYRVDASDISCDYFSKCDLKIVTCIINLNTNAIRPQFCTDRDMKRLTVDNDIWTGKYVHTFTNINIREHTLFCYFVFDGNVTYDDSLYNRCGKLNDMRDSGKTYVINHSRLNTTLKVIPNN